MSDIQVPPPATAGARVASYVVDLIVVVGVAVITWVLARSALLTGIVVLEAVVVLTIARAATGLTPGGLATKTIAYAVGTDHAPGLARQSLRSVVQTGLHLTVLGPLLSAAATRRGQDLADRVSGTAALSRAGGGAAIQLQRDAYGRTAPVGPAPMTPPSLAPTAVPEMTHTRPRRAVAPHGAVDGLAPAAPAPAAPAPAAPTFAAPAFVAPTPPPAASLAAPATAAPPITQYAAPARPAGEVVSPAPSAPTPPPPSVSVPPASFPPMPAAAQAPVAAPTPPPPPAIRAWAVLDSGQQIELAAAMVLGREPIPTGRTEQVVMVPDPSRSLSRTHLRLGVDPEGFWVEDAFSANGSAYIASNGKTIRLVGGVRTRVPNGTVVLLGDRRLTLRQAD